MTSLKKIKVLEDKSGSRLDIFLSEILGITRSSAKRMVDDDLIKVNGKRPKKAGDVVHLGDGIDIQELQPHSATAKNVLGETKHVGLITVVEEQPDYIVVNKPSGLLVHPTEAGEKDTLVHWVIKKYPEIKKVGESLVRPGIMHRLDKEASGLLVIARTQKMFQHLKNQFQKRQVEKIYFVLVYGTIEKDHGILDFDIDRGNDGRMVARPKTDALKLKNISKLQPGKQAISEFWVEQRFVRFTLLKVKIHTGRTHQIRVHMFAYGHPVVGDTIYMNRKLIKKSEISLNRLFLHATRLCFDDLNKERKCFIAEMPTQLQEYIENLK